MSEAASEWRLLVRDEEELKQAALLIRGGGPVVLIIVCPPEVQGAASRFLDGQLGDGVRTRARRIEDPEEILGLLAGTSGESLVSMTPSRPEVMTAINWHREKLRRGDSIVLIWLSSVDALRRFREQAPDAYSFRDSVLLVQGERPIRSLEERNDSEIPRIRRKLKRARTPLDRVGAMMDLSERLWKGGDLEEAERLGREALEFILSRLKGRQSTGSMELLSFSWSGLLGIAYGLLADIDEQRGRRAASWRWTVSGIQSLATCPTKFCREQKLRLESSARTAPSLKYDRTMGQRALREIRSEHFDAGLLARALQHLFDAELHRGNLKRARRLFGQIPPSQGRDARSYHHLQLAALARGEGDLRTAEAELRKSIAESPRIRDVHDVAYAMCSLGHCLFEQGENRSAREILTQATDQDPTGNLVIEGLGVPIASIATAQADIEESMRIIREAIRQLVSLKADIGHYIACRAMVDCLTEAWSARRVSGDDLAAADRELELQQDVSIAIAGADPPWYRILFPGLRARLLATRADRLSDAIALARSAFDLALAEWRELAPAEGRRLGEYLLRAGDFAEAERVLSVARAEATAAEILNEGARIDAALLELAVHTNAPPGDVQTALDRLRQSIDATGSRRIQADILLDLAQRLPSATSLPDPLALAEEAYQLYLDMPMPAKDARALETAGDILAARGRPVEARRRYLAARARSMSYGILLRMPVLDSKIDSPADAPAV